MTHEDILKALGNVQEPDLGKDIVTLNIRRDITIEGNHVTSYCCVHYTSMPFERLGIRKQIAGLSKDMRE